MAVMKIRIFPDPVLRQEADLVEEVDEGARTLIADMIETMHAAPGVGLAAPQVGESRRIIVADPSSGEDPAAILALINPVLLNSEGIQSGHTVISRCPTSAVRIMLFGKQKCQNSYAEKYFLNTGITTISPLFVL